VPVPVIQAASGKAEERPIPGLYRPRPGNAAVRRLAAAGAR